MQHLDVLQRSGLVRSEKVGRVRTCRLEPGPMRTLEQWIVEHRAIWERHFDRLSDVLDDAFPPHRPRRPPMSIRQHDFTIERRFRQTPAQTFRAFADPELKQRWFGAPESWTDAGLELDFRVGGSELSVGRDPGGALHEFRSRYHDIVDGERIVFAYDLLLDGRLISVSLTTVEVRPDGNGTRLVFTEHGAFFDDLEDPAEREHGTGLLLDGLAAFLAEQVAA